MGAMRPLHVDVRVVAATNRDLRAHMRAGKFREDLYYRLFGMPLMLPPLRSRRGDVRALAEHFVRALAPREQTVRFSIAALDKLEQHTWPGNVRELRTVVQRALLLRKNPRIDAGELTFEEAEPSEPEGLAELELPVGVTLEQMLLRVERQLIENTLRRLKSNRDRTARVLGMGRSSLYWRLKALGLGRGMRRRAESIGQQLAQRGNRTRAGTKSWRTPSVSSTSGTCQSSLVYTLTFLADSFFTELGARETHARTAIGKILKIDFTILAHTSGLTCVHVWKHAGLVVLLSHARACRLLCRLIRGEVFRFVCKRRGLRDGKRNSQYEAHADFDLMAHATFRLRGFILNMSLAPTLALA